MQEVAIFESKKKAEENKLQSIIKSELSILHDDLKKEERVRREYDQNFTYEVNVFLNKLKYNTT